MADGNQIAGDLHVPLEGRTVTKSIGCWNCKHYETGKEVLHKWWKNQGEQEVIAISQLIRFTGIQLHGADGREGLAIANMRGQGMSEAEALVRLEIEKQKAAQQAVRRLGLQDPVWADMRLDNHRNTIAGLNTGKVGECRGKGVLANGDPVGTFVYSGYHCHKWSGSDGWSVAQGGINPLDMLPAEMVERADEKAKKITPSGGGEGK